MRDSRCASLGLLTIGVLGLSIATAPLAAQSRTASETTKSTASRSTVPRTPWGTPDLQGTWSFATATPLERPSNITKEFLSAAEIADIEKRAVIAATDEARGADA